MLETYADSVAERNRVYAHLRVLGREMGEMSRRVSRSIHLHHTQLRAVDLLLRHRYLSPGDLSRMLGISSGSTTALVDNLVRLGHVRRMAHPRDRRKVVLEATDQARKEVRGAFRPVGARFEVMLEQYSAADLQVIDRFLHDLRSAINEPEPAAFSPTSTR